MAMYVACARNPARDGLPDYAELAADRGARHRGLNGVSRSASPSPPRIASRAANPLVLNCAVCGLIIIRSTHRPTHKLGCDCAHPLVTHNRRASGAHCPSRSCHAALGKCRVHWGEELVLVFSTGGEFQIYIGPCHAELGALPHLGAPPECTPSLGFFTGSEHEFVILGLGARLCQASSPQRRPFGNSVLRFLTSGVQVCVSTLALALLPFDGLRRNTERSWCALSSSWGDDGNINHDVNVSLWCEVSS